MDFQNDHIKELNTMIFIKYDNLKLAKNILHLLIIWNTWFVQRCLNLFFRFMEVTIFNMLQTLLNIIKLNVQTHSQCPGCHPFALLQQMVRLCWLPQRDDGSSLEKDERNDICLQNM